MKAVPYFLLAGIILVIALAFYQLHGRPRLEGFLLKHLDHTSIVDASRDFMKEYSSTELFECLSPGTPAYSNAPATIRVLQPQEIWISGSEIRIVFWCGLWKYGFHVFAHSNNGKDYRKFAEGIFHVFANSAHSDNGKDYRKLAEGIWYFKEKGGSW